MERNIRAEFWNGKKFAVSITSANKQTRGFSLPNESPHKHDTPAEMGVKSYCKGCGELTEEKSTHKLFRIGKEDHRIPIEAINAIKTREEKSDIVLTFPPIDVDKVYASWADLDDWFDDQKYVEQVEKKEGDYGLLKEALRGKMAFGKAKFGFNEYAIVLYVAQNNKLRLRQLVEPSQRYSEHEEKQVSVSQAMVDVLKQIAEKKQVELPALNEFAEDSSRKAVQALIERAVNGEVIASEVIKETIDRKEADELAELQKLLVEVN